MQIYKQNYNYYILSYDFFMMWTNMCLYIWSWSIFSLILQRGFHITSCISIFLIIWRRNADSTVLYLLSSVKSTLCDVILTYYNFFKTENLPKEYTKCLFYNY